jgi:hypothetical protein
VPAFIYLCNMATEGECLDRMLFGTNAADSYSSLDVGDRVFLYNYELGILRGPFVATTKSTPNLVPGAWRKSKGRFPWQIRVDGSGAFKTPLRADDLAAIIPKLFIRRLYRHHQALFVFLLHPPDGAE